MLFFSRLLQMALTAFGVERFTKVTVQYIPRHWGHSLVCFRYSEEKSGGACLGALIPEKNLIDFTKKIIDIL